MSDETVRIKRARAFAYPAVLVVGAVGAVAAIVFAAVVATCG